MPNSEKLSNLNRVRHTLSVASIIPKIIPTRFHPTQRVGSSRTADGAVFILRDPSKVGKIVFYNTDKKRRRIMNEFRIGKRMGDVGVGPRVYDYFKIRNIDLIKLPQNLLARRGRLYRNAIFIIMQNLGYGAKKIETLSEYVRAGNPYPYGQMKAVYERMIHRHGMKNMMLLHGDLHMGNVLVRTFMNDKKRLYFIDYGRSIFIPYDNALLSAGYYISPKMGVPRGINTQIVARNVRNFKVALRPFKNTSNTYRAKKSERLQKKISNK
jgi:hypothetical protein